MPSMMRELTRARDRVTPRHVFACAAAVLVLLTVVAVGPHAHSYLRWASFASDVERLNHLGRPSSVERVYWSFPFHDETCTVMAKIDADELAMSEAVDTSDVFGTDGWEQERYVFHLVATQVESPFIHSLAAEFKRLRREHLLDDDEYVELMACAVQALPYGTVHGDVRLPIETVAYGDGICTEKSLLLASLLVHEGYDTVIWVFESQHHVAVGVACDGEGFQESGYAFIETTGEAYVGQAAGAYRGVGPTNRPPQTIPVGGELSYRSAPQVEYILSLLEDARSASRRYASYPSYVASARTDLKERYREYARVHHDADGLVDFITRNSHNRPAVYEALAGLEPDDWLES
jgi:hypothetical protein